MRVTRPGVVAALALCLLTTSGCGDSTSPVALGKLSAKVVDSNNLGIQGVSADLYRIIDGGGLLWRASLTSSSGIAVFGASDGGVIPGDYEIHISFINNYRLAAGETNDRPVTVQAGDDLVVTFHAESQGPGH